MLATRGTSAVSMIGCTKSTGLRRSTLSSAIQRRVAVPACMLPSRHQQAFGSRIVNVHASSGTPPSFGASGEPPKFDFEPPKTPPISTGGSNPPAGRVGGTGGSGGGRNPGGAPQGNGGFGGPGMTKLLYFALAAALAFPVFKAIQQAVYPEDKRRHGQTLGDVTKEEMQRQKYNIESAADSAKHSADRVASKAGESAADAGRRVADSAAHTYSAGKEAVASAGHKVADTVGAGVDKVKHGAEKIGDQTMDAAEGAQMRAQEGAQAIKHKAGDVKHKAQETGEAVAEASREKADGLLAGFGKTVDHLRGKVHNVADTGAAKAHKGVEATKHAVEDAADSTLTSKPKHDWRWDTASSASGIVLGLGILALGYYIEKKGGPPYFETKGDRKPRAGPPSASV